MGCDGVERTGQVGVEELGLGDRSDQQKSFKEIPGGGNMAKRPNVFDQAYFERRLLELGCTESFVKPIVSDYRLFVPLVFKFLGEDRLLQVVDRVQG
jgi:hypothetical protein